MRIHHVLLILFCAGAAAASASQAPTPTCDRACLDGVLDQYLAALLAHDPGKVRWAAGARTTENNVELLPGDGLWGTITALDDYQMRFADPATGGVAIFGVVQETTTKSPYALRLKVVEGSVAEAEAIVVRPEDAGIPFVTADIQSLPVWNQMLPPAQRTPRQQMIDAANGYFETLQRNDGTLHVQAGAGIVADSDPEYELAECRHKAGALIAAAREAARIAQDPDFGQ